MECTGTERRGGAAHHARPIDWGAGLATYALSVRINIRIRTLSTSLVRVLVLLL